MDFGLKKFFEPREIRPLSKEVAEIAKRNTVRFKNIHLGKPKGLITCQK